MMEALQITARLASPYATPRYPTALDGLVARMICNAEGHVEGVGDHVDVEVPIQRSACGRYHLASVAHYIPEDTDTAYLNKTAPVFEFAAHGNEKTRRRTIDTGTGVNKRYHIPLAIEIVASVRWWCVGERKELEHWLAFVKYLGLKASAGYGQVARIEVEPVEPWPGSPIVRPDGTPTRNLPIDTPGLGPATAIGWGPLSYPYWKSSTAVEIAQPSDTQWMGPTP